MPMGPSSMLKANMPQTPNGTALNASMMLGLPGLGNDLQDQMKDQVAELRKKQGLSGINNPTAYGAGDLLNASGSIFGTTR